MDHIEMGSLAKKEWTANKCMTHANPVWSQGTPRRILGADGESGSAVGAKAHRVSSHTLSKPG